MPANSALKAKTPRPDPAVDFALVEALCTEIPAKFRRRRHPRGVGSGRVHTRPSSERFGRSLHTVTDFPATWPEYISTVFPAVCRTWDLVKNGIQPLSPVGSPTRRVPNITTLISRRPGCPLVYPRIEVDTAGSSQRGVRAGRTPQTLRPLRHPVSSSSAPRRPRHHRYGGRRSGGVHLADRAGRHLRPSALLTAELGTAFAEEGGPYIWTSRAFGRLAEAVNNFLYWVTNPVWLGGTLSVSAVAAFTTFFNDGEGLEHPAFYVFTLLFIWVGVLAAILSFDVGKSIPPGAWSRFVLLGLFTLTVVIYAFKHGLHGFGFGDFYPNVCSTSVWSQVLMFNYVGFELPNTAGDEMTDAQGRPVRHLPRRRARRAAVRPADSRHPAGPPGQGHHRSRRLPRRHPPGFHRLRRPRRLRRHGHPWAKPVVLGDLAAVLFILTVLSSGVTWIMGSDRALAVSGYDGAAPRGLGVISERFGTPVRVNLLSGVLSTGVLILAHQLTGGNAGKLFGAVLGLAVSTTLISYLGIFPALPYCTGDYPQVERAYRAPAAWPITIVLTLLILFASVQLLVPGAPFDWFSWTSSRTAGTTASAGPIC